MNNTHKIISLYKYIKELYALKYTVVTDFSKQYWTCSLKDIPNDSKNISIYYRDRVEEEANDNMVLLEVRKPEFQRCPEPPSLILEWLEPGWDKFTISPILKKTLFYPDKELLNKEKTLPVIEKFEDSKERVELFEKWITLRVAWADKQRDINETRSFFAHLFQAYTDIERESETLEFMIGNGFIHDLNNPVISHPVLMKRVKFDFDAKENIIRISDTDTEPELYTLLLQEMTDINTGVIRQLKDDLRENFYHPLDRNDTPDYLKILTHLLCSEGKFILNEDDQPGLGDKIVTRWSPVYFIRKRIDGTIKAIEEIIENIEKTDYVPGHLIDFMGDGQIKVLDDKHESTIDQKLAALSGENVDILLSKEANLEQLQIAERIELYNAVLVQGPPGTGKTHTIANLLGHFLAQGKNVLVTSHTKKALSVLKSQVPQEIQNLCVSVLDDTNLDMVRSVEGISEYLSRYTSSDFKKKMVTSSRQRTEIIEQLATIRRKVYAIKYSEFNPIVYNGESFSPSKVAEFVNRHFEEFSYIPGNVRLYHPLPVSVDDLHFLYESNKIITNKDETELAFELPNPKLLISPAIFSEDVKTEAKNYSTLEQIGGSLSLVIRCNFAKDYIIAERNSKNYIFANKPTNQAIEKLASYINSFNSMDTWMIQAAVDGHKGGGFRQKWEMLISSIEDTSSYAESIVTMTIGKTILFKDDLVLSQIKPQIIKLSDIFKRKGKISKIDFFFNKSFEKVLSHVSINGGKITSSDDCYVILRQIELLEKRAKTEMLWDELMAKQDSPSFATLGDEPEEICRQRIPNIQRYLDWYKNEFEQFKGLIDVAGFNSELIFDYSDLDSVFINTEKILKSIHHIIPLYIQVAKLFIELTSINQRRQNSISILSEGKRKNSTICITSISALHEKEIDKYEESYSKLSQLFEKYPLQATRIDILAKIESLAPAWANAISDRNGIHGEAICPDTIEQAWKWKQFAGIIEEITAEPYEELQKKSVELSKELRKKTAELAANKAWYHLLLNTEQNIEIKQALLGWKLTVKKIGKGTGKNAPVLRKQARDLMAKCQVAVPAWIMPVGKALENFTPSINRFDVAIVDEASQSDLSALAIMYFAKKVIIVGDDKQVSPMAVGLDIDRINALRDMYIKDVIPNWHLYDAKTSLYDIAGTTYQSLMLREHFRCVPDIIGYSNKLSYNFEIKPLRDSSNCVIVPPLVNYRVMNGQREGRRKINVQEAEYLVSLMVACMKQPEYDRKTFGAISLLGEDQAKLIQQIIFERLEPSVIQERRILCGNASHFQGDERDVIFLSMVDSNEGDGPLKLSGEGADQSTKQRYNVAASRAKDQLWIIHSLDYSKDLKSGDIRRDLLEYSDNPKAFSNLADTIEAKSESPFEEAIGKSLVAAGYHITQQWEVGAYRIDMVVQYKGKKIAIECDGEQYHSGDEKIRADMERQTILERMGWRFIRIRGSEYYRDPDATMKRVINELTNYGILQESIINSVSNTSSYKLLSQVKIHARQIIDEWRSKGEAAVEDGYDIKNNILSITKFPSTVSLPDQEDFAQISIDQLATITSEKSTDSTSMQSSVASDTYVEKNKSTPSTGKRTRARKSKSQKIFTQRGEDILNLLKQEHFHYIDKIEQSGIIWVLFSSETKETFENIAKNNGYRFSFEKRGSSSTGNKPAWRIMVN